jgi:hypothetical protein
MPAGQAESQGGNRWTAESCRGRRGTAGKQPERDRSGKKKERLEPGQDLSFQLRCELLGRPDSHAKLPIGDGEIDHDGRTIPEVHSRCYLSLAEFLVRTGMKHKLNRGYHVRQPPGRRAGMIMISWV